MLAIGAAMMGALHVVGVDVDDDALRIAQQNVDEYEDHLPVRRQSAVDLACILLFDSLLAGGRAPGLSAPVPGPCRQLPLPLPSRPPACP